ncbi:hypothetical protein N1851_019206 [Merluccius polli]|uniref:Uncharacterized protein n=1 Tax=Merluccius polli TaxID=89951 RepID=A0AA47MMP5_MERPO|nr:hypothetical protein N1851_019206 [Merluccius polli]
MCATAVSQHGTLHHRANLGPFDAALLITFLDTRRPGSSSAEGAGPEQPHVRRPLGLHEFPRRQRGTHVVKLMWGASGGQTRHSTSFFFPRCLARESIACGTGMHLRSCAEPLLPGGKEQKDKYAEEEGIHEIYMQLSAAMPDGQGDTDLMCSLVPIVGGRIKVEFDRWCVRLTGQFVFNRRLARNKSERVRH